jgi:hypothetical protein
MFLSKDSNACSNAVRLFPPDMICNPNLISKTVTEVVQTEDWDCRSSHAITFGSGAACINAEKTLVSITIIAKTLLVKCRRLYRMTTELRYIARKPLAGEQGSDFGTESARGLLRLICGAAQNVADLFLHAAAIAAGAALQAGLHAFFEFTNYDLRHDVASLSSDIMISL